MEVVSHTVNLWCIPLVWVVHLPGGRGWKAGLADHLWVLGVGRDLVGFFGEVI